MFYHLEPIKIKECQENLLLLYGDEVPERNLPLSRKEIETSLLQ